MIQAVLFDFGGVFTPSPFEAARDAGAEFGLSHREAVELVFGPYDRDTDHPWHRVERGELTFEEYREEVRKDSAERGVDLDPLDVLRRIGGSGSGGVVREDVVEVVRTIRVTERKTALVTNNVAELRDLWRPLLPLDELFDVVIDSSEVGVRKPDPRIFELTLERVGGVDPADAVFLDDYAGNVSAAEKFGMKAILVEFDHRPAIEELLALLG